MPRMLIGAVVAAMAMFIIGFIFFATPLSAIGYSSADLTQQATVQQALAANLPHTGTYSIPSPSDAATTNLYSKGPIATIHYNSLGYGVSEPDVLIAGFIHEFVVALLMGFALLGIASSVTDFAVRARVVILFSLAGTIFIHLGEPIWYHHDWRHFIYLMVGDTAMLVGGGLVIARWFLPRPSAAHAPVTVGAAD